MASVACIGECMVELRQAQGGQSAGHSSGQGGRPLLAWIRRRHPQHGGVPRAARGQGRLSHRAWRRCPERRDDRGLDCGGRRHEARRAAAGQAARPLHDPAGCEGRAPVLPLARQCGGAPADEPAGDGRSPQLPDELRHRLSLCDHALDLRRGRARAPVRGDQARAPARHPLRVRHQFSRAGMAGSRCRARGVCQRPSRLPTSC